MKDWTWLDWMIAVICIALPAFVFLGMYAKIVEADEFMAACTKDHKLYECKAMWRSGSLETVIPIVVPTR